jgi:hypothetical protein
MPYGIDPSVQPMQPPGSDPDFNCLLTHSKHQELPATHNPMLSPGKLGKLPVIPTSPRKPVLRTG